MRSRALLIAAFLIFGAAATMNAGDFENVVAAVEKATTLQHRSIPFMGLGRFVVNMVHPDGVHDLRIAMFEKNGRSPGLSKESADEIEKRVRGRWNRLVSSKSRGGEQSLIFAQRHGALMRLLIVADDDEDLTVVQLELDPERVDEFVK